MPTTYLVRHGKTEFNKKGLIMGHQDSPLLDESKEEIKILANKLKNKSITRIYSSNLGRAYETAKIISQEIFGENKVILKEELKEIDYGDLSGKKKKEVSKQFPLYHNDIHFVNPQGESFKQLYDRLVPFINSLSSEKETILLVTHAGCIRAIYSYVVGEDFQSNINMRLDHQSVIKCELSEEILKAEFLSN